MNGPEHYREAEHWATVAKQHANGFEHLSTSEILALAQLHATLALAAATAHPAERYSGWPGAYGS